MVTATIKHIGVRFSNQPNGIFTIKSLRCGGAQDVCANHGIEAVKSFGPWKSNAFKTYLQFDVNDGKA
jgi:hypothetical protein